MNTKPITKPITENNIENNTDFLFKNISKFRKEKAITQKDLADKTNVTRQSIYYYEKGQKIPSAIILYKIAKALDCNLNDFFKK